MRALVVPALLLSLAACTVGTDDLVPRTSAECAASLGAGSKACGNRCVTATDPATGCAAPGCLPCPAGPHGEAAACDATGACSYAVAGACASAAEVSCGGACVDPQTSTTNCGGCGKTCAAGAACVGGACQAAPASCAGSDLSCSGVCVDPQTSTTNCGGCGKGCAAGAACVGGACQAAPVSCAGTELSCGGACVDPQTSTTNCGGCGKGCAAGVACVGGACRAAQPSCAGTELSCGGACVDPQTSTTNCGGCGTTCAAGVACVGGSCRASTCAGAGELSCGGACVNAQTDALHCGACDHACGSDETCSGGVCSGYVVTRAAAATSPRELLCWAYGTLAFLDAGGAAWFQYSVASTTAYGRLGGSAASYGPSARLASADQNGAFVYVAGLRDGGQGGAVFEYDPAAPTTVIPIAATSTGAFTGLAVTDRYVYYTGGGADRSLGWVERYWYDTPAAHASTPRIAGRLDLSGASGSLGALSAVATAYDGSSWHVFVLGGSVVVHLEEVAAAVPPVQRSVVAVAVAAADHLAAVWTGAGFVLYVADGATGRVTRIPLAGSAQELAGPAATSPGHMALAADAAGAVWTDAGARTVTEYRASDGAVFRLAGPTTAAQPWGVCLGPWSGYASWSDAGDHVVRGEYR